MTTSLLQSFVLYTILMSAYSVFPRRLRQESSPPMQKDTVFGFVTRDVFEAANDLIPPADSPNAGQLNITLAMQLSVLSGSVHNIGWLLLDFDDVRALGLGFKFPPNGQDKYLKTDATNRRMDPDVVAIRGLASAALSTSNYTKLADIFLVATYGLDFFDQVCTPDKTVEFDDYGIPNCHEKEILEHLRSDLVRSFEDQNVMQSILSTEPPPVNEGNKRRSLLLVGEPVNTWQCAHCFESNFCAKHVHWCQGSQAQNQQNRNKNKQNSGN